MSLRCYYDASRHDAGRREDALRSRCMLAPGMRALVGTSGYSYKEWKGRFYPVDLPAKEMLPFYAARFHTVEINNTFYRMPSEKMIADWVAEVPPGFTFALKAPQRITHQKRLKDVTDVALAFVRIGGGLGESMGPLLFQLPPFMKKDVPRIEAFLAELPSGLRVAFEFRHASWFDDEVYETLRTHRAALCTAEGEGLASPLVATTDWGYLRLRLGVYSDEAIAAWAKRLHAPAWKEAFVYFKHDEGGAPGLAAKLLAELTEASDAGEPRA
jgi:uncharacterized protein YecE (DUF72 family)